MNQEEKYKQALERARDLMTKQNPPAFDKHLIGTVFPELEESEDDRIKREILDYINELANLKNEKIPTEWLDWLEKQGEQTKEGFTWKPSKEQIAALRWVLNNVPYNKHKEEIKGLLDQIKDFAPIEPKKVEQGNHPRIVMADFNGGEGFYKLNLDNLNKEQVNAIEIMINNPNPSKRLDADKVIEWIARNAAMFWESPCNPSRIVELFKQDFGL